MNNKVVFLQSFREVILLLTVFFVMLPIKEMGYLSAAVMLLMLAVFMVNAAMYVIRDKKVYTWDKGVLVASMVFETLLIVVGYFVTLPAVVGTIAVFWAAALMALGVILCGVYPMLVKKGKLQMIDNNDGTVLMNYLIMAISILAVSHTLFQ